MLDDIELIEGDLVRAHAMFKILEQAAAVDGVYDVKIVFKGDGDCDTITVGYGMSAEPAIVAIEPGEVKS